jgi:hypothetical protein
MNQDDYLLEVENSLVYFLITISKLNLSKRAGWMLLSSNIHPLKNFVPRNQQLIRKPKGILIL